MFNTVILSGRLTADPELKSTKDGLPVTTFTIANEVGWGEKKRTSFIDVVAWRGLAETICRQFSKGDSIGIEGQLQTRSRTARDGVNRKVTEVIATAFQFLPNGNKPKQDYTPAEEEARPEDFRQVELDSDMPF